MTKRKKLLYKRKQALKDLIHEPDYAIDINGYRVGSFDYSPDQFTIPVPELTSMPHWNWVRCTNKKQTKMYYIDYGTPSVEIYYSIEAIAGEWATYDGFKEDIPFFGKHQNTKGGFSVFNTSQEFDEFYEKRRLFYIDNNNWNKTLEECNKIIEKNLGLERILVSVNRERDGFNVVIPASYKGTIKASFEYALPIMFEGKEGFVSQFITERYVAEIEPIRFVD